MAPTLVLSFHASYRCGRSGACCTSGWAIAVEPDVERRLRDAATGGALQLPRAGGLGAALRPADGLPDGARSVLACDGRGRCAFYEAEGGGLCAIHRQLGHGALPVSCRQFPRVALLTPAGVAITLSHYCPTAAGLLFEPAVPATIVTSPPAFSAGGEYEGLDARAALPPFLRPGVLLGWDGWTRWQEHAAAVLAAGAASPEAALARLAADAERARSWSAGQGPLLDVLDGLRASAARPPEPRPGLGDDALPLWGLAVEAIPAGVEPPRLPADPAGADERWVASEWPRFAGPIGRYLAARAFASWCALQGSGLRTTVRAVAAARAVLRLQTGRLCARRQRPLDAALLREAIRASDLLLVHLCDPAALARRLSALEARPVSR